MKKGSKYTPEQLARKREEMRLNPPHLGVKHSAEARKNISLSLRKEKHPMWGKKFTNARRKKISDALTGRKFTSEHRKNLSLVKTGMKSTLKGLKRPALSGEHHPNWQGGITPINQKIKNSQEYKTWRDSVFKRDNFTCILCYRRSGKGQKVVINADHIKPFSLFPELRFVVRNGRTLCVDCHRKTDTFAGRIRHYIYD